jgi:Fic family protein
LQKQSGRYEAQVGGYRAFIPDPLPPKNLEVSPKLLTILSRADVALGRLDGAVAIVPDVDWFVAMFVRKEAVLSSQIEGTHASLADVLEFEALMEERAERMDLQEVVNYVAATQRGVELLKTLPISDRLLKEVHAVLMRDVRGGAPLKTPGEFRKSQNWIGGATPASARFVPPPWEEAQQAFFELEKFMNGAHVLPPLIIAGLIHVQFETIHPFLDGNGRTGRMLIIFWLMAKGILSAPVLYPSLYLKRQQEEYIRRMQACREESAWTEWLEFFLDAVAEAAVEATRVALDIVELRKQDQERITKAFPRRSSNALRLHQQLFSTPIVNMKFVEAALGVSQPAANALLNEFESLGIVREITGGQRNKRFSYERYLKVFPGVDDRS